MPEPDRADLERVAAEIMAAVERMLQEGEHGIVFVAVTPGSRRAVGRVRAFRKLDTREDAA